MKTARPPTRRRPVIIRSTDEAAAVLRGDREALQISGEALDEIVGWQDRYTAKAESPNRPWGRALIRLSPLADLWLQALGRCIVIMDRDEAEALAAGLPPPVAPDAPASHNPRVRRIKSLRIRYI